MEELADRAALRVREQAAAGVPHAREQEAHAPDLPRLGLREHRKYSHRRGKQRVSRDVRHELNIMALHSKLTSRMETSTSSTLAPDTRSIPRAGTNPNRFPRKSIEVTA